MSCNAMRGEARGAMTQKMRDMCDTSEENAKGNTITTVVISICRHEKEEVRGIGGLLPMTWRNGSLGKNAWITAKREQSVGLVSKEPRLFFFFLHE